ncbi:MAG: ABC transporter substrate-binding protein [Acidobacteriaceae bacterium]|nr:ABC transporter substrate-binding protein [Acidobacteriaceae bacterium]
MGKWIRYGVVIAIVVIALLALLHVRRSGHNSASVATNPAKVIRIGTNRALGTVTPYVARDKNLFLQQGLQVEIVDFNDVTTLMEAFSSGQLDVALVGIAPSAIWQGKGVGLKVVAAANGGGHVLLTRTDTGIDTLKQLKGKKVATPKPGTVTDTLFRASILENLAKLDPDKDIQIVPNMSAADMPTVLFVSREVDAAITWEPFASQAEARYKNAKVLYDASAQWRTAHPDSKQLYPVNVVIARQGFIDARPDDLRRLLAAYSQAIQFINDHPEEANELISHEIQLDKAVVTAARRRIDYTARVDVDASLQTLQWSKQLGYLKAVPAPSQLFDLSYLPKEQ